MIKKIIFVFVLLFATIALRANSLNQSVKTTKDSLSFIQHIENWYQDNTNYYSITALMACESSVLPVPSEIVIPPAVYVSMDPKSDLSIFWIIIFGTLGAIIGATFNYFVSMYLGRFVVYKFADSKVGKLLMLSSEKIKNAEIYFNDHGKTSTFVCRFIPVIRHLISIPAGLSKMNYLSFVLFTGLGAGLWNCALALLGYFAGENRDLINKYSHELSYLFIGIAVILVVWLIIKTIRKKK
jgi:membrane protein DedA with SNARE-associated domain